MDQRLIILRGAPASGKSTIAKKIRNFEEKMVWLKVDAFKDFFAVDADPALDFVNGAANATLAYLLDNGFSVVAEGVFQKIEYIDSLVNTAKSENIPYKVFELEVSLKTLKQRDRVREGVPQGLRPSLGDGVMGRIYGIIKDNPHPQAIKMDAENYSIEECIEIINKSF